MKHRADVPANTDSYPNAFRPKHCNENGLLLCMHDHPGDKRLWRFLTGWRRTA